MVDYYKLLEISRNASFDEISQAIRKTRRLWNNRANSPDSSIRAEAEQHVREVAEAEKTLLDNAKREAYDRELDRAGTMTPPQPEQPTYDWEEEFFDAYNHDMCDIAEQIAQNALRMNERNGRAWFLYGEAIRRGGDPSRAITPLRRAAMLTPNDVGIYRQLGIAYGDLDQFYEGIEAFGKAADLDPNDCEYHWRRAELYRRWGDMEDSAFTEAQIAYRMDPNDDCARFEYCAAIYLSVKKNVSYNRSSGKHLITNERQLNYANGMLQQMSVAIPQDASRSKCMELMEEIVKIVADGENPKGKGLLRFGTPGYMYNYRISTEDVRRSGIQ